jgi:predicted kinase
MIVILTKGLPGSGKSTWAKQQILINPGHYKIINKDSLRAMLDGGVYSPKDEQFILKARNQLILLALSEGFCPIVDDTNLDEKHERAIRDCLHNAVQIVIQDFTMVPLQTCIERDQRRVNSVGEQVIRDMWQRFLESAEK